MQEVFFSVFPTWQEAPQSYVLLLVLLVGGIAGFSSKRFYQALIFHPYEVFRGQRVHTLFTSALIHRNWKHLLINVLVIYGFAYDLGNVLRQEFNSFNYLWIFIPFVISSIALMNILIGYLNKDDFKYTCVGASALACSLVGASLSYFPMDDTMGNSYFLNQFLGLRYAYHYWGLLLMFFLIMSLRKNTVTNHKIHLYSYLYGSIVAVVLGRIC